MPPRTESYADMWRLTLCPSFKYKSFTFINSVVQGVLFFIELILSATDEKTGLNEHMFLGLHPHALD